jgi:hypothetical protein
MLLKQLHTNIIACQFESCYWSRSTKLIRLRLQENDSAPQHCSELNKTIVWNFSYYGFGSTQLIRLHNNERIYTTFVTILLR